MKKVVKSLKSFFRMLLGAPVVYWKGVIPEVKTEGSACFDLIAKHNHMIHKGRVYAVETLHSVELPKGYCLEVLCRSSMGAKGIFVVNAPGIVDSDYRGPIMVILSSLDDNPYYIKAGDRVAQARVVKVQRAEHVLVDTLSTTARGENGLGSTGA